MSLSVRKGTSQSRDPAQAAQELFDSLQQPDIKFAVFYCAPEFDLPALAAELHRRFGDIPMIGCTSAGEITPQGYLAGSLTGFSLSSSELDAAVDVLSLDPFDSATARGRVQTLVQGLGATPCRRIRPIPSASC